MYVLFEQVPVEPRKRSGSLVSLTRTRHYIPVDHPIDKNRIGGSTGHIAAVPDPVPWADFVQVSSRKKSTGSVFGFKSPAKTNMR